MSLLKDIFGKKGESIKSYEDFWKWFQRNEKVFSTAIRTRNRSDIEKDFFDKLSPKLNELKEGFFFLTGIYDENTVELVLTADGVIKNLVFVEDMVNAAPEIPGWKFTAHKAASDIKTTSIRMAGHEFKKENLNFCSNDSSNYPDEIDITVVHNDFNEENKSAIINGTYIFLDNYLGELEFVTTIDNMDIKSSSEVQTDLIPIEKLKDFLIWKQKEFLEKYDGVRRDTENDTYSMLEAELPSGNALLAIIDTDLLDWDSKASHPWILTVEIKYDGEKDNGMPDDATYKLLDEIENTILEELKDFEGYLNIGRQTAESVREIYLACKDFRKPSRTLYRIQNEYSNKIEISYEIYKDKYWKSFDRFN
ncbi:MAG TPA: DUF695 domain-containing protein [Mucilaginibacter sp.]|jgi:hypothetical protein|nr:DUF695 domain-containing protein [Mucilaginibacter sp.]